MYNLAFIKKIGKMINRVGNCIIKADLTKREEEVGDFDSKNRKISRDYRFFENGFIGELKHNWDNREFI